MKQLTTTGKPLLESPLTRQLFLGTSGGLGLSSLLSCHREKDSVSPESDDGTTTAASSTTKTSVPDPNFALIPANPSFRFTTDVTNKAVSGEVSAISSAYTINKYLVTRAQYKDFLTATGKTSYPKDWTSGNCPTGKGDHPVLWVSMNDAQAYCDWLTSKLTGWRVRLPSQAE